MAKFIVYFEKSGYMEIEGAETSIEAEQIAMDYLYINHSGMTSEGKWEMVDETEEVKD